MNKCTRSAFLDDISINILKIVDNIVLLTLNKRRHLFDRDVYDYTWTKYLQPTEYKFNKEKLQILRRIAKSFKPKNILRVDIP